MHASRRVYECYLISALSATRRAPLRPRERALDMAGLGEIESVPGSPAAPPAAGAPPTAASAARPAPAPTAPGDSHASPAALAAAARVQAAAHELPSPQQVAAAQVCSAEGKRAICV